MACKKEDSLAWLAVNVDKWSKRPKDAPEEERAWLTNLVRLLATEGVLCDGAECDCGSLNALLAEARERVAVRLTDGERSITIGG